ncbi:TetR family transcriptional regulator [Desulfuribacillus stibiiarsenatis]|uniref:TetR family transcriptional regulator n=1 Tax=Desulfuribacillus stibiiarsenatis TaxID=1390249 RepID=A0A1E5L4X7_9FIRM|nr:TetR/AcrR family transcriptional regulator [Desulfuribacillus stibiiarsenatis]OEH85118.1 TetR family transcriptional regulator [Desulfuribacillus stibiiarsenatis]
MNETTERIIDAAIELIKDKGYAGATTKAIAKKAGVNEVTIFRHFGTKKGILEAAAERISYVPVLSIMIRDQMTWNLEHDLSIIASSYQHLVQSKKDLILIAFKDGNLNEDLNVTISKTPLQLKKDLMEYFSVMQKKGLLIECNLEAQAMNFIWLNFGYFIQKARLQDNVTSIPTDEFIKHSIMLFARALTP